MGFVNDVFTHQNSRYLPYILLHSFDVRACMINNKLSCWWHLTSYANFLYDICNDHRAVFTCPEARGTANWMPTECGPLAEWNTYHIFHTVNILWSRGSRQKTCSIYCTVLDSKPSYKKLTYLTTVDRKSR